MQGYRGMPILTQAPSAAIRKKVKIHLVDFLDPSGEYSAAGFRRDAAALIPKILKKKKTPVIVGGTGLYLRALLDGLFETPEGEASRDENFRKKMISEQEKYGDDYLHGKLLAVDPVSAGKIHPHDVRRLVRALEVFYLSGKPMSEQKANRRGVRDRYHVRIFLLDRERSELYARIDTRVDAMIGEGLVNEVKRLRRKKMGLTAGMALGFREISAYLSGGMTLQAAAELLKKNTRHYAKRQLSWFRHEKGVEKIKAGPEDRAKDMAGRIAGLA